MTLQFDTVTDAISKLTVAALKIKDIDEIPVEGGKSRQALLIPKPVDFMTDVSMVRKSFGGGSSAKMDFGYVITYRLLYKPIGDGRSNILAPYPQLIAMIRAIWDAILAIDVFPGCEDIIPAGISMVGPTEDPTGVLYWGADFSFRIMEFVE